jgi:hypothetical protein
LTKPRDAKNIFFVQPLTPKVRGEERLPEDGVPREMWMPCIRQRPSEVVRELGRSRPPLPSNEGTQD